MNVYGWLVTLCSILMLTLACSDGDENEWFGDADSEYETDGDTDSLAEQRLFEYTEEREACNDFNPLRNLYFGDWHAHSSLSWDAFGYDVRTSMDEAYAFAKGESVWLPPLDGTGKGTRQAQIDRPLDFVGLSDHIEYFGEHLLCTLEDSPAYTNEACKDYREGGQSRVTQWGVRLATDEPKRMEEICGDDLALCRQYAEMAWQMVRESAERAYDRTASCEFVTFPGYEYTGSAGVVNWHRVVMFRNALFTDLPPAYYEYPIATDLWKHLQSNCLDNDNGCDVMVLPHNSNWSNGNLYTPYYSEDESLQSQRDQAQLRLQMEPVLEGMQHKGDMECKNGFEGIPEDPYCDFEKIRESEFDDCGDTPGWGGVNGFGCLSKLDYIRNVWAFGLQERQRLGVNPYKSGVIGSTDNHNGTPGMVSEVGFLGHVGMVDDTAAKRLGEGTFTHNPRMYNPGGLAAVWAQEKSRDAIFDAMQRREIYTTSGPRIRLRFFGGYGYSENLCLDPEQLVAEGYEKGVPMGSDLSSPEEEGDEPVFMIYAEADEGSFENPGTPLQRAQIIKVWIDSDGKPQQQVFDVAQSDQEEAAVDEQSCERTGEGEQQLCAIWSDPDFDPSQDALYYARVIENPSCRWVAYDCNPENADELPEGCSDSAIPKTHQERAWSSPIWWEAE